MGSPAVRIGPEDFLTPPEFRDLPLGSRPTGQVGGVRLELTGGDGPTRLGSCYQQIPLRVLPPFHFSGERASLLYLLNPTAGLMDGDAHLMEIEAGPGACAVITGQSANRIHPALQSFSTQQWRIRVAEGAILVILPGPAIPFRGARYYQRAVIEVADGAKIIWGDLWVAGRYARAEKSEFFAFDRIIQDVTVRRQGRLVFRDRFHWQGPWDRQTADWHFGEDLACGSLYVTGFADQPTECAKNQSACFSLASGDTCMRWCGNPEKVIADLVATALHVAGNWTRSDRSWLISSHHLAPNHWFNGGIY